MLIHRVSSGIPYDTWRENILKDDVLKLSRLEFDRTNGDERGGTYCQEFSSDNNGKLMLARALGKLQPGAF